MQLGLGLETGNGYYIPFFFLLFLRALTTPQVERCDWNAGGNYIPSANDRVQVEGHFVTDGVCVWL